MDEASMFAAGLAVAGAAAAAATALTRPRLSLMILFLLASLSRVTLETAFGTMRMEQPAIAIVALILLASGRWRVLQAAPRLLIGIAAAFGAYLLVLLLSSALVAPDPTASLRMAVWLAVSMVGGALTFVLLQPAPAGSVHVFAAGGAANGLAGAVTAALFLILGPEFQPGIQDAGSVMPRVYAFSREANLYASFLAICAPFALEAARRRRPWLVALLLVVGAVPLGETRGAYLALAAGLLAYGAIWLAFAARRGQLPRLSAATGAALVLGMVAATILLPNPLERYFADAPPPGEPSPPIHTPEPGASGAPTASLPPEPTPAPSVEPPPSVAPYPDTINFRLERVPVAFADLQQSPLIGLGFASFGQRHADPSQDGLPDHIAILAVAVLHDAGLLGAGALGLAVLLLARGLWGTARMAGKAGDWRIVGAVAACSGSVVAMLVAYQATNALHFAVNWMILGAALALLRPHPAIDPPRRGRGQERLDTP